MSNEDRDKPILGITIGDINGIGPEVVIKTFSDARMLQFCTPVIYASQPVLNYHRKIIDAKNFNVNMIRNASEAHPRRINLVSCWPDNIRISAGTPSQEAGQFAFQALSMAANDAKEGKLQGLVTAPIDKHTIQSEEFPFPGHTEFLTSVFGMSDSLMFLTGEYFRIGVVTGHVPLAQVSSHITKEKVLSKIRLMNTSLVQDFGIRKPRIAVLGLNPHAGENGLLGTEEQESIIPALATARENGLLAFGPFPADGFFGSQMNKAYDGILAMYHDQGLVPFKLMNFEGGVNYTAGLPIVRTSPDHGTAYSIAGKNIANEQSFREAVYVACEIIRTRKLHVEVNANPLQSMMVKEKED